jgi:AcrR family transcriptional regulator
VSTSTGRRPRRPASGPGSLLEVCVVEFNTRGYDATSMEDLSRAAGITKSSFYHHFASKEALLAAALDEALERLSSAVDAAADATRGGSAYDRLRATVDAAVHILVAHLPAVTLLLRVRGNSALEQSALERRRHIDEQLARVVRQAADEGDLRDDLDPEVISRLLFGMVNSLVDWYHPDGPISPESIAEAVTGVLFRGLHTSR